MDLAWALFDIPVRKTIFVNEGLCPYDKGRCDKFGTKFIKFT